MTHTLGSWCEFRCRDDANAWRKSTKEADKHKIAIQKVKISPCICVITAQTHAKALV